MNIKNTTDSNEIGPVLEVPTVSNIAITKNAADINDTNYMISLALNNDYSSNYQFVKAEVDIYINPDGPSIKFTVFAESISGQSSPYQHGFTSTQLIQTASVTITFYWSYIQSITRSVAVTINA